MRILYIGAGYPPESRGGTEVHLRQLARAMLGRGHDVSVLCRSGDPTRAELTLERGEVEGIPVSRLFYRFGDVGGLERILSHPGIDDLVAQEVDRVAPDLVHVHHLTGLSTSLLSRVKDRGIPLVMTLHDFWTVCLRGQRIRADLDLCTSLDRARCAPCLRELWPHFSITPEILEGHDAEILQRLRRCDALLTPSSFHRERMLEIGLDADRIFSVPHGLDHDLIPPRRAWRFPPRKVGFIGSVIPTKGVHVLVDAMARLENPEVECHVYGEAPSFHGDEGYVERLRAQTGPEASVTFHGAYGQEELPAILADLDVLVVPSLWWETFCLTIREAMLAGLPVVASDLGAMHEALAPLELDLLFRPGDAQDLSFKLYALATDENRYRRAGDLRAHVRTLEAMAQETEAHYRRLAGYPERIEAHRASIAERKVKGAARPYATVFVPTWNGGELWKGVLEKILSQETTFDYEVLVIDSGSTDGTLELTRSFTEVRLIEIPNSEFNHGLTRNRAVKEARGDVVVLLTQDAEPLDETWLQTIVDDFDDPDVAGAYCHQIPREHCNPFQRDRLAGWTRGEGTPQRKRLQDRSAWEGLHPFERYRLIAFDDVASAVRASVMEEIPYEKRQFGEDVTWGRAAILAGHTLVMDPRAVVIHSHDNSVFYEFKRVYLDHQNLNDLVGLQTIPTLWHVATCSFKATGHLLGVVWRDPRSIPYRMWWTLKTPAYAFSQNLAQYLGARSTMKGRKGWLWGPLDRWLRKGV